MSAEIQTTPVTQVAAAAAATPPATPPPATPAQPQTVTIPLEQLQTFTSVQARLAQMEADQRSRDEAARAEQVKLLAAEGRDRKRPADSARRGAEDSSTPSGQSRAAVEERAKRYALDGEVSRVLASQPLVPGGAEQLTQLWRNQFVVEPQGDSFTVRTPTFQSVGDFVAAQLARPEYAHFIRASNPGGGTAGHDRCAPGRPDVAGEPGRADPAQELRRGDHPADAGDPEESAHRSTAEPGRRHGPQFEVDGPPGVDQQDEEVKDEPLSRCPTSSVSSVHPRLHSFPHALRGQAGRGSQRHENRECCTRSCQLSVVSRPL